MTHCANVCSSSSQLWCHNYLIPPFFLLLVNTKKQQYLLNELHRLHTSAGRLIDREGINRPVVNTNALTYMFTRYIFIESLSYLNHIIIKTKISPPFSLCIRDWPWPSLASLFRLFSFIAPIGFYIFHQICWLLRTWKLFQKHVVHNNGLLQNII